MRVGGGGGAVLLNPSLNTFIHTKNIVVFLN